MNVLVIGGGISDEREISLRSARYVYEAVPDKHNKLLYDWKGEEALALGDFKPDVVLPILHGPGGEDGIIQAILEQSGLPYLGSDVPVSKICIDKVATQKMLAEHGVLVPKQATVSAETYTTHSLTKAPHVLKPINGGSSLDTYVCLEGPLEPAARKALFAKYPMVVLEEFIDGQEITVPVLDGYELPVIKIVPPSGFFDYTNKYSGETQEICAPEDIDPELQHQAIKLAKACHDILGCRHLSRVDIMMQPDGTRYVLEVNTMPGLTDESLFPRAAAHIGLAMPELIEYFIELAAARNI